MRKNASSIFLVFTCLLASAGSVSYPGVPCPMPMPPGVQGGCYFGVPCPMPLPPNTRK